MSYLGESVGKLGFGLMRLPMDNGRVDQKQVDEMADRFLARGFTYFDTAYGYLDGQSEAAARKALVERHPRESFLLATKLPAWAGAETAEQARQMFWTSLERTGAGYFDFYLMHNMGGDRTAYFEKYDIWSFLLERKAEGLIRHLGFSFHDKADVLDRLLTQFPEAEFVQLQINYADWESASIQSRLCYETARRHNKPVVIMEPVKGGSLTSLPPKALELLRSIRPDASPASWALRFAASLDGVITVLSGMSALDQMDDNLNTMSPFQPLDDREQAAIAQVRQILDALPQVPCTRCQYCVDGCPQGVAIPGIFKALNNYLVFNNLEGARGNYEFETRLGGVASKCVACGQCEAVCPQHIRIIDELARARDLLEKP